MTPNQKRHPPPARHVALPRSYAMPDLQAHRIMSNAGWAYVTQGEPRFAPHPIQDSQPGPVQRYWVRNRSSTWSLLARPGRFVHYAELRKLLIKYGDRLAEDIDYSG